jgi:hypothetical protein
VPTQISKISGFQSIFDEFPAIGPAGFSAVVGFPTSFDVRQRPHSISGDLIAFICGIDAAITLFKNKQSL